MKNLVSKIDWKKVDGLVPAIIQNSKTGQILMFGYMNRQSLRKTFETGRVWFYSRSKKRLWMKGEVSKNTLTFLNATLDCDNDTLLVKVEPQGPTCHTGEVSCFKNSEVVERSAKDLFVELYAVIADRKLTMPKGSYTSSLFKDGLERICGKIYEEAAEVVKAAKRETKARLIEESVDLLYHLFVLLAAKGIDLDEFSRVIEERRKKKS